MKGLMLRDYELIGQLILRTPTVVEAGDWAKRPLLCLVWLRREHTITRKPRLDYHYTCMDFADGNCIGSSSEIDVSRLHHERLDLPNDRLHQLLTAYHCSISPTGYSDNIGTLSRSCSQLLPESLHHIEFISL